MDGKDLLQKNVSNLRFIAWDTETTGIDPRRDAIVEIAALCFDEEFEQRSFEQLIAPGFPIPLEVTRIHGITDAMVADAPNPSEGLARFFEFLNWAGQPRVLLAHNAGFDVGMLHGAINRGAVVGESGVEVVLDTCLMAKNLLPDLPSHRLGLLVEHFKITTGGQAHRAGGDVKSLHGVFMKLLGMAADRYAGTTGLTLETLVNLSGGYFLMSASDKAIRRDPFRLPPRLEKIEAAIEHAEKLSIVYEVESDVRYITPKAIRTKGFRVYVDAYCHRDSIEKTFRADKILRIG